MTLRLHDPAAPRLAGCEYGGHGMSPAPRDHGTARVCAMPGCRTILRRTNPDDVCDPCQRAALRRRTEPAPERRRPGHERVCLNESCRRTFTAGRPQQRYCSDKCRAAAFARRKRGEAAATAAGAAGTDASPPPRPEEEEGDVASEERKAAVLEALADGEWHRGTELCQVLGISHQTAKKTLTEMAHKGLIESGGKGGKGFRLPQTSTPAPDHPTGAAPATTERDPEHPADPPAPSPSTPPEEPAAAGTCADMCAGISEMVGLRPFAGQVVEPEAITTEWFTPMVVQTQMSRELRILDELEQLEDGERQRVLSYAVSRWFCP